MLLAFSASERECERARGVFYLLQWWHHPLLLLLLRLLQMEMHASLLLSCYVLAVIEFLFSTAHMVPEERLPSNSVVSSVLPHSSEVAPPPITIVGKVTAV